MHLGQISKFLVPFVEVEEAPKDWNEEGKEEYRCWSAADLLLPRPGVNTLLRVPGGPKRESPKDKKIDNEFTHEPSSPQNEQSIPANVDVKFFGEGGKVESSRSRYIPRSGARDCAHKIRTSIL